ncbi:MULTISPECIES: alpha-ketoglutarate-dependent dioxygenase AlkB family protein [Aphanothece]|uniref:alpha-ketoglutarate-dependent dioxygenase AlkB family protein n=1 Tax=Aphanothece TaxID=1121 RepID=UPI003984777A
MMASRQQLSLLGPPAGQPLRLERPGLVLRHWPAWLDDADLWLERLLIEVPWKQEWIVLHGRRHPLPRLTAAMGDPGCHYSYSGVANPLEPWSSAVEELRRRVEALLYPRDPTQPSDAAPGFTNVLLNLYRDGHDHMGWHADAEPSLDPTAPIASLSLGASRCFRLRPRTRPAPTPTPAPTPNSDAGPLGALSLELGRGDLLVMDPPSQRHWQHQLPPRRRIRDARINLTFRRVIPRGGSMAE